MSINLPIVMIGGTLCDQRIWAPIAGAHKGAIIMTAGQDEGVMAACSDMVSYVQNLLRGLPEKFVLVGFSLGGLIALEMIAQSPERIAAMALICAGLGAETDESAARRRADEALGMTKGMADHALDDLWPRFNAQSDDALPTYIAMAETVGMPLYRLQNDLAISRQDSSTRIAEIKVPVLLVSGEKDALCPVSRLAAASEIIPNARHVVIENAGHMVLLEQPERMSSIMNSWLADTGFRSANELLCT